VRNSTRDQTSNGQSKEPEENSGDNQSNENEPWQNRERPRIVERGTLVEAEQLKKLGRQLHSNTQEKVERHQAQDNNDEALEIHSAWC